MTTSGTTAFSLLIADAVDEAFERVQVDLKSLNAEKLISARRSLDLLFIEWENEIPFQCKISEVVINLAEDDADYTLDTDIVDIVCCITRKDGLDYPVFPMSREEYHYIHDKTIDAERPTRFFLDKQTAAPVLYLFPVPDSDDVDLRIFAMRQIQDTGGLRYTPDVARRFYPAVCAGLAWKLAEKYAPDKVGEKAVLADMALKKATQRDAERADVRIIPVMSRRRRY